MTPLQECVIPITKVDILLCQLRDYDFQDFPNIWLDEFIKTRMIAYSNNGIQKFNQENIYKVMGNTHIALSRFYSL